MGREGRRRGAKDSDWTVKSRLTNRTRPDPSGIRPSGHLSPGVGRQTDVSYLVSLQNPGPPPFSRRKVGRSKNSTKYLI